MTSHHGLEEGALPAARRALQDGRDELEQARIKWTLFRQTKEHADRAKAVVEVLDKAVETIDSDPWAIVPALRAALSQMRAMARPELEVAIQQVAASRDLIAGPRHAEEPS